MQPEPKPSRTRETILVVTLSVFVGGIIVFFLNLISLGVFAYVVGAVPLLALLGVFHYLVWGHALTQEVAAERREMLQKEEQEAAQNAQAIQDLSRKRGIQH